MIYFGTEKDRIIELSINILERGYFVVIMLDNMKEI